MSEEFIKARELARGRWPGLLKLIGLSDDTLSGKHVQCPICHGRHKHPPFRFDNLEGRGTWICSGCGAGDGFKLFSLVLGISLNSAYYEVLRLVDSIPCTPVFREPIDSLSARRALRAIWSTQSKDRTPVIRYLKERGLREADIPVSLRYHPSLLYFDAATMIGKNKSYPGMLALIQGKNGEALSIHRTYLDNSLETRKKICKPISSITGGAIRLFESTGDTLIVAEGIETALSAKSIIHQHYGNSPPAWALISANNMMEWCPPSGVDKVIICGDNDESHTGQMSAYTLSKKLRTKGIDTVVAIPSIDGFDWNDVLIKEHGINSVLGDTYLLKNAVRGVNWSE